ncbi:MAG TPA: sulfurtransferase complex subunit TusB [Usitatibacter sp.]|nr:sulfurtransferase complex subunit TusB [Usitatibacter sp.]
MLHTVNKSPFEHASLEECLRFAREGSAVLLIEDGIYGAVRGTSVSKRVEEALKRLSVYALGADVEARGMQHRVMDGVRLVDYGGFVDLVVQHNAVQAWL